MLDTHTWGPDSDHEPGGWPPPVAPPRRSATWIFAIAAGCFVAGAVGGALVVRAEPNGNKGSVSTLVDAASTELPSPSSADEARLPPDAFRAGRYLISDVQISRDLAGSFHLRASVTNTDTSVRSAFLKATLVDDDRLVATLSATVDSLALGETRPIHWNSQDDFVKGSFHVEVEVTSEFF